MTKNYKIVPKVLAVSLLAFGISVAGPGMADGGAKFLGNITTSFQVRSDFGTYWNQITAENECKWGSIEGNRGSFGWDGCDACYNWAKQNGGHFKFHALVWGGQYPGWLNGLSPEETRAAIENWFDKVAERYPDLEMIDVVNEAIRVGDGYHSPYGQGNNIIPALGGDDNGSYKFVATAFEMARDRWPNAILIYNDYNTFRWQINEGIDLVNKLVEQGAPVDAYGQQAHDLTDMDDEEFYNALNKIQNSVKRADGSPMPLYITEYDIGTDDDDLQKRRYETQITAFWESEQIAGITLWGYIYGATWTKDGNSGIIRNGQDRPAMTWLKQYFKDHLNDGQNNTNLGQPAVPPPDPTPYKGVAATLPGKIEMENYDEGGSRSAYRDNSSKNEGDADIRTDEGVDLVKGGTGTALGYTNEGEWIAFTVDVKNAGKYTVTANVSSGATGAGFKLQVDGEDVGSNVEIPKTGSDWDTYEIVDAGKVNLTAGSHIIKVVITGNSGNIDYIEFSDGTESTPAQDTAQNPAQDSAQTPVTNPVQNPPIDNQSLVRDFELKTNTLQDYYVIDPQGGRMGIMSAYGFNAAVTILKESSAVRASGIYYLRSRSTGHIMPVKVMRK